MVFGMVRCVIMGRDIRSHCLESGTHLAMIVTLSRKDMMICNISSGKQQVGFDVVNIFLHCVAWSQSFQNKFHFRGLHTHWRSNAD